MAPKLSPKSKKDWAPEKPAEEKLRSIFQTFDRDGNGTIEKDELAMVLRNLDAKLWDAKRIERLLSVMDTNKDDHISYEEFCTWLFSGEATFQRYRFEVALNSIDPELHYRSSA
eukprot:TRINITY_DN114897_c0_g1_i1.p1 TRINITY_DN114897_c0_g1~~TRINITY_DN114897_c0_g1_i1.p1  ORF type:complete len:114 (+),score=38.59 TRINITY_DN114897_c0_g1_i1:51-392(+)